MGEKEDNDKETGENSKEARKQILEQMGTKLGETEEKEEQPNEKNTNGDRPTKI